jgi:hypothetical protein
MEWKGFKLSHELHLRETVRDIKFLHDETMYSPSPFRVKHCRAPQHSLYLVHSLTASCSIRTALHNHQICRYAVAQKKYTFIYDNTGMY